MASSPATEAEIEYDELLVRIEHALARPDHGTLYFDGVDTTILPYEHEGGMKCQRIVGEETDADDNVYDLVCGHAVEYYDDDSFDHVVEDGKELEFDHKPLLGANKPAPRFSVSEVAKTFFGRSPHWIRLLETEGRTTLKGQAVANTRTQFGARSYTVADIELLAHALYENEAIDEAQLILAVTVARNVALSWGITTTH